VSNVKADKIVLIPLTILFLSTMLLPSVMAAEKEKGDFPLGYKWDKPVPLTFKFVDQKHIRTTPGHPCRNWTEAEKKVARAAINEWNVSIPCYLHRNITEIDDPFADADVTLRWEKEPFMRQKAQQFKNPRGPYDEDKMGKHDDDEGGVGDLLGYWQYGGGDADYPNDEIYICDRKDLFVDPTPALDEEFIPIQGGKMQMRMPQIPPADKDGDLFDDWDEYDLYTLIKHEFGHALGLDHVDDEREVMFPILRNGERKHLLKSDLDSFKAIYQKQCIGGYSIPITVSNTLYPRVILWLLLTATTASILYVRRRKRVRS
jgi:hypothetical protein